MASELLSEVNVALAEAFTTEIQSLLKPQYNEVEAKEFSDLLMVLNKLGLSHFWSTSRVADYMVDGPTCLIQKRHSLISAHHRFYSRLILIYEGDSERAEHFLIEYMEGSIRSQHHTNGRHSILGPRLSTSMATHSDQASQVAGAEDYAENFIKENLWLGTLHMLIAFGIAEQIVTQLSGD